MHSGRDWSFKERLYTNTTYNTADETLKGNGCNESEDSRKLRHKFQNSTFQDILHKIDSERPHVAAGVAQFLKHFLIALQFHFFETFVQNQKAFRVLRYSVTPRLKMFRHSGDLPFHHSVE